MFGKFLKKSRNRNPDKPLTRNIVDGRAYATLSDYQATGGYEGLRTAITTMDSLGTQQVVKDSELRGRGGAGFPTGLKWSFVPMGDNAPET